MQTSSGIRPPRAGAAALLAAAAFGCSEGVESVPSAVTVRDSAGVSIVESVGPSVELPLREAYRLGVAEGDSTLIFDQVRAIVVATDGSLWISDSHPSVRHYTPDGQYLGSVGGAGDGPGESSRGYGDIWASDTQIFAHAHSSNAMQSFTWDGGYVDSQPLWLDGGSLRFPLGHGEEGWWYRDVTFPASDLNGARELWSIQRATAPDGRLVQVIELPGHPVVGGSHGWSPGSFFDGYPWVALSAQDQLYYSAALDYEIQVIDQTGNPTSLVRRVVERRRVPRGLDDEIEEALRDGWRQTLGATMDDSDARRMLEAVRPDSEPRWLPAIDMVLADAGGGFWVRRADLHPQPAMRAVATAFGYVPSAWLDEWKADWRFDMFSSAGHYRGTVTLPADFIPMFVSHDTAVGVQRDDLDVEYIVAFEIAQ